MFAQNKKQGGFIKLAVILIIVLIVLGYFGFNIQQIIQSPTVSGNLSYAWDLVVSLWNNVLVGPATFIWDKIIIGMIWNNIGPIIDRAQTTAPAI